MTCDRTVEVDVHQHGAVTVVYCVLHMVVWMCSTCSRQADCFRKMLFR